ncbi:MAG TPA: CDP-alcohol phosphatidyltransferase family protein [Rudaea sp.]|jgi:cardiolipin synthase|nr:CDP-alcohol phosphatidyltransferase family protein [Rudaea sp.]
MPPTRPSPLRHLPNALTALRMLLVIPLVWLIRDRRYDAAVIVALVAGFTDALDGWLAKHFDWQSWIGGIIDPIADKLMLIGCFVSLGLVGAHPEWLTWLVVGRDVLIVAGAIAYHAFVGRISGEPTLLSKINTCVQIVYVVLQLVHLTTWFELPPAAMTFAIYVTAAITIVSGLQYVAIWSAKALRIRARERTQ